MAFRIETREEMLSAFLILANDEQRAQVKIQQIMERNRIQEMPIQIRQALLASLNHLSSAEPSSWKLFDWFVRNMSSLLLSFEQVMRQGDPEIDQMNEYMNQFGPFDPQNPPEIDVTRVPRSLMEVNAQAESLMTLTENAAIILKTMPQNIARPNIDGMSVDQVFAWVNENSRYINSARWEEMNPVYQYENGWKMIHLTNEKDFQRAGKELGNCIRHSPPPEGGGFLGHPGIFVLIDEAERPLAALRMGRHGGQDMYVCFDAKSFDSQSALQIEAEEYKQYINEFLQNTNPADIFGEELGNARWQAIPQWLSKVTFIMCSAAR